MDICDNEKNLHHFSRSWDYFHFCDAIEIRVVDRHAFHSCIQWHSPGTDYRRFKSAGSVLSVLLKLSNGWNWNAFFPFSTVVRLRRKAFDLSDSRALKRRLPFFPLKFAGLDFCFLGFNIERKCWKWRTLMSLLSFLLVDGRWSWIQSFTLFLLFPLCKPLFRGLGSIF